jgi:BlaI family transcriptional regulator, penicillinase repressor
MPKKKQAASDAELAILRLLWNNESLTAREIREVLYPAGTPSDHGTVQKLLQRLEGKKLITRDSSSFVHVFRAKVSRCEMAGQQLETLAEKLTEGSLVPFIMHAVGSRKLTLQERKEIRQLLDGPR